MSAVGHAFQAIRRIVLMDSNISQLQASVSKWSANVDGLADGLAQVRDRVSRLEGFLQGAAAVRRDPPPQLPPA